MTSLSKTRLIPDGNVLVGSLAGDVDLITVRDAADQLVQAVPTTVSDLVLDLSEITYLDSRGVHILLEAIERLRMRGQTTYVVAPELSAIRRLIEVTGVTDLVPVVGSVDEALQQIRARDP